MTCKQYPEFCFSVYANVFVSIRYFLLFVISIPFFFLLSRFCVHVFYYNLLSSICPWKNGPKYLTSSPFYRLLHSHFTNPKLFWIHCVTIKMPKIWCWIFLLKGSQVLTTIHNINSYHLYNRIVEWKWKREKEKNGDANGDRVYITISMSQGFKRVRNRKRDKESKSKWKKAAQDSFGLRNSTVYLHEKPHDKKKTAVDIFQMKNTKNE